MPKWPFKWPFKEPSRDPATEEALRRIEESPRDPATEETLRRIEEVRKSGATLLDLSKLERFALRDRLQLRSGQLLYGNPLSTLPEAIGQLSQLQKLDLSDNKLSTLPEAIGQLATLQELNLSGNKLSWLPDAIGQLAKLQKLDLSDNKLSTLPEAVQSLERLEKLFLHGNPGLGLPDEVLGPTFVEGFGLKKRSPKPSREILDYYFATRGAKGRALREVKLIVVGRGGAGKTSLIKRLKGETFDPHEGETHGINIRELELACADGPVQARVWDFGGQHVLHAMHEFSSPRAASTCWCSASATTWPSATPPTGSSSFAATPDRRRWSWR